MNQKIATQPDLAIRLNDASGTPAIRFLSWVSRSRRMSFQSIPAGEFRMGARHQYADEEPIHLVRITRAFYLGTYPVTQAEFAVWTKAAGIEHENDFSGNPRHPAENMDWHQAMQFCEWLSAQADVPQGFVATLPSEAQWEYACRAGTDTEYYTGDGEAALAEAGWYSANSRDRTQPVGGKRPNAFGLYDMHGNVWEWCRDAWDADAYKKRVDGAADPEVVANRDPGENTARVFRGGGWVIPARLCRSAIRYWGRPSFRIRFLGFRVCLVPGPVAEPGNGAEA